MAAPPPGRPPSPLANAARPGPFAPSLSPPLLKGVVQHHGGRWMLRIPAPPQVDRRQRDLVVFPVRLRRVPLHVHRSSRCEPQCAILKISSLSSSDGAGKAAAAAIPRQILQPIIQAVPYFDFAAMLPAFISMVVVLLAAGFACCSDRTFYCSKFWVVVAMPCLLLTLGWYGALLGGGILSDRAIFLDQWNRIAGVCTTSLPMLDQALVDADAALADAERREPQAESSRARNPTCSKVRRSSRTSKSCAPAWAKCPPTCEHSSALASWDWPRRFSGSCASTGCAAARAAVNGPRRGRRWLTHRTASQTMTTRWIRIRQSSSRSDQYWRTARAVYTVRCR